MGSPSGDMLCAHLAQAAVLFHVSNFSAQTAPSAVKTNTSRSTKQKANMGKWEIEEGIGTTRLQSSIFPSVNT